MKQNQVERLPSQIKAEPSQPILYSAVQREQAAELARRRRAVPASYLFCVILATPLGLLGALPIWNVEAGAMLILFLSAPLFVGFCILPIIYFITKQADISIMFVLVCIAYLLYFGLRAYYHVFVPEVVLFPSFDPATDFLYMHRGLLWGTIGFIGMTLGYMIAGATLKPSQLLKPNLAARIVFLLDTCSVPGIIIGFYMLGLLGRAYALATNSASWIYHSPAYDLFATRPDPFIAGPMSLFAEFCPLAFAALLAYQYQRQGGAGASRRLWVVALGMFTIEITYNIFTTYKFGLLGTFLTLWLIPIIYRKKFPKWGIILVLVFGAVVFPVTNAMRQDMRTIYSSASAIPNLEWASQFVETAQGAYADPELDAKYFLDTFIVRLDGAESLAVAEKYLPRYGYEWGSTYFNLFLLTLPRVLRFGFNDLGYINWEQDYAGMPSYSLTVIPLPVLVEAYLNFGLVGVLSVMFLIGGFFRLIDVFLLNNPSPLMAGLLLLVFWRMLDIETNLFIVLPALIKTVTVFLVFCWLARQLFLRRLGVQEA